MSIVRIYVRSFQIEDHADLFLLSVKVSTINATLLAERFVPTKLKVGNLTIVGSGNVKSLFLRAIDPAV